MAGFLRRVIGRLLGLGERRSGGPLSESGLGVAASGEPVQIRRTAGRRTKRRALPPGAGRAATGAAPAEQVAKKKGPDRPKSIHGLALHPTRPEAITIGADILLTRWSLEGGEAQPIRERWMRTEDEHVGCLAAPPDGMLFTTAPRSAPTLQIWRWDDLVMYESITLHFDLGRRLGPGCFSPDGRLFAVRGGDEALVVIERGSIEVVDRIAGGEQTGGIQFSPDSHLLAASVGYQGGSLVAAYRLDESGRTKLAWETERTVNAGSGAEPAEWQDEPGTLAFTADGDAIAYGESSAERTGHPDGWIGNLSLLDAETGKVRWETAIDVELTDGVGPGAGEAWRIEPVFAGDQGRIVCVLPRGRVLFFAADDGRFLGRTDGRPARPVATAAGHDGHIWVAYEDGALEPIPDK